MNREELGNHVEFIMKLFIKSLAHNNIGMAINTDGDFIFNSNESDAKCMIKAGRISHLWDEYYLKGDVKQ